MSSDPDLIIWGASIRTLDGRQPFCSAVAIKDGLIVAAGDDDSVRATRGPGTEVIDGRGIALVPGLTDAHIHPISSSIATRGVDAFDCVTLEELRAKLRAEAATLGPDDWVVGWGLHYEMFGPTGIRGDLLEEAVGGRPTYLRFFDGHNPGANLWQVTNQVSMEGSYLNRYDVTILCNGLPLVQVELKKRGLELKEAVTQILSLIHI